MGLFGIPRAARAFQPFDLPPGGFQAGVTTVPNLTEPIDVVCIGKRDNNCTGEEPMLREGRISVSAVPDEGEPEQTQSSAVELELRDDPRLNHIFGQLGLQAPPSITVGEKDNAFAKSKGTPTTGFRDSERIPLDPESQAVVPAEMGAPGRKPRIVLSA